MFSVVQGTVTYVFLYNAIRYLPLVEVSLITNTMPLFTAVMGLYLLKEHLLGHEVGLMITSFIGVIVLITGKTHLVSIEKLDEYPIKEKIPP